MAINNRWIQGPWKPNPQTAFLDPDDPINRAIGTGSVWVFGDGASAGWRVSDLAGNHNGSIAAAGTISAGKYGRTSLGLNGTSTYVNVGSGILLTKTKAIWGVALVKSITQVSAPRILNNWNASVSAGWSWSNAASASSNLTLSFIDAAGTNYFAKESNTVIHGDGIWHLVGFDYTGSGTSAGITLYLDGLVDASTSRTLGTADPGTLVDAGTLIGARETSGSPTLFTNGSLDIVRLGIGSVLGAAGHARLFAEPYAGIVEAGPRWRVGPPVTPPASVGWGPLLGGQRNRIIGGINA